MDDAQAARRERLRPLYSPEVAERTCRRLAEVFRDRLTNCTSTPTPVLPRQPPERMITEARAILERTPSGDPADAFADLAEEFLRHSNRLHSPNYIGHQVPPTVPVAALFEAVGALSNQGSAVYEMGQFAMAAELAIAEKLARFIGWPPDRFAVIGTHGGSLANLTALLTARNVRYPESWKRGLTSAKGWPAIVASPDSHYCIARAAGILGLGTDQVLATPLDARRRIDSARLEDTLDAAASAGYDVFAIVGSAGSTPIGAFDPLMEIADIAFRRELWLHVDGAHGASAAVSPSYRHLVRGIDRADSIVWDAHKMLYMPALCTFLFYRDVKHSYRTFEQNASYLYDPDNPGMAAYDAGIRTLECTKRAIALALWGTWAIYGQQVFQDLIDVTFSSARQFYYRLLTHLDFQAIHEPECNILCFRHVPASLRGVASERLSAFQLSLRLALVESGEFYITGTSIDGVYALRLTVINPLTDLGHFDALLDTLRRLGKAILDGEYLSCGR